MSKKSILILCLALVLLAALTVIILRSHVQYDMMSCGEQLKWQLMKERNVRTHDIFERVEVERPWYSISPSQWTFVVTFTTGEGTVYYRRVVGQGFVPC